VDEEQLRRQIDELYSALQQRTDRDPDDEVGTWAIPVIDVVLTEARRRLPDDPIVGAISDLISPETAESRAEPVRAVDALLVVGQLRARLEPPPRTRRRTL
jgi:hypothetical protein